MNGRRVIAHGGGINGFISSLMHVPQDSLIIAVLANTSPAPSDAVAASLARAVLGLPAPTPAGPPKDLPLTADERARYVGEYKLTRPDGTQVEFQSLRGERPTHGAARRSTRREDDEPGQ